MLIKQTLPASQSNPGPKKETSKSKDRKSTLLSRRKSIMPNWQKSRQKLNKSDKFTKKMMTLPRLSNKQRKKLQKIKMVKKAKRNWKKKRSKKPKMVVEKVRICSQKSMPMDRLSIALLASTRRRKTWKLATDSFLTLWRHARRTTRSISMSENSRLSAKNTLLKRKATWFSSGAKRCSKHGKPSLVQLEANLKTGSRPPRANLRSPSISCARKTSVPCSKIWWSKSSVQRSWTRSTWLFSIAWWKSIWRQMTNIWLWALETTPGLWGLLWSASTKGLEDHASIRVRLLTSSTTKLRESTYKHTRDSWLFVKSTIDNHLSLRQMSKKKVKQELCLSNHECYPYFLFSLP